MIPRTIDYYLHRTSTASTLSRLVHSWVLARPTAGRPGTTSWRRSTRTATRRAAPPARHPPRRDGRYGRPAAAGLHRPGDPRRGAALTWPAGRERWGSSAHLRPGRRSGQQPPGGDPTVRRRRHHLGGPAGRTPRPRHRPAWGQGARPLTWAVAGASGRARPRRARRAGQVRRGEDRHAARPAPAAVGGDPRIAGATTPLPQSPRRQGARPGGPGPRRRPSGPFISGASPAARTTERRASANSGRSPTGCRRRRRARCRAG